MTTTLRPSLIALVVASIPSCDAVEVVQQVALETGRQLLKSSIARNYGTSYEAVVDRMLESVIRATLPPGSPDSTALASSLSADAGAGAAQAGTGGSGAPGEPVGQLVEADPIELEVAVLREESLGGRFVPVELQDGDTIRDGVGRPGQGDNIKIRFEVNQSCHIYAVWIDATGWVTPIFPTADAYAHANPATAGLEYTLPEGNQWFYLDEHRGIENLYFVASHESIPDLESALGELLGREREFAGDVSEPVPVEEPYALMRGIGGTREGRLSSVRTSDDRVHEVQSQVFIAEFASSDLVVTRWFRHE